MNYDFDDNRYSAPTEVDMDYAMNLDDAMAMKAGLPIPKRVGIQRNLITGEIVDYNEGLVFNPTTGRVLQVLPDGKRQIVPKSDNRYGWMVKGVDRLLNQPQSELTTETPTDGTDRFLGDAIYSGKRNRSIPWQADMGYSPRSAQVYQNYPPEIMARIGQHGKLENYGSMMVYDSFVGKDGERHWYGRPEKEHPTTLMYQNKGKGNVVPALSIPRDGKNDVIPISEAVTKGIVSPAQARDFNSIPTPQYATDDQLSQWAVGKVKVGEDATIRPLQNRDGSFQTNYRSTYVDATTGDVYNVTSDKTRKFHLIRPEVSEESYGFPRHKQTTNLTQEMIGINQEMKIGGNETITDTIREDPSIPGLEYFNEPVVAGLNPITGRPEIKYVHKGNNGTWVNDDANTNDLFNYWQLNQESQGQSMVANDLARGQRRVAGIRKAPAFMQVSPEVKFTDGTIRTIFRPGISPGEGEYINATPEAGQLYVGINRKPLDNTGFANSNATPAYSSLQDSDYLGNRIYFNNDGIVVDRDVREITVKNPRTTYVKSYEKDTRPFEVINGEEYVIDSSLPPPKEVYTPFPSRQTEQRVVASNALIPKSIQNFTPASDFYSQGTQVVRDLRTGKVIYDPNRSVVINTPDGQYGVVPYAQDKETIIRRYGVKNYQPRIENGKVVGKENYETGYVWGNKSVSPASASHTKFYKLPVNPANVPIGAYRVNEYGTVLVDEEGYPLESEGVSLPRSAQIANVGSRSFSGIENAPRDYGAYPVEYPYRFDPNNKGITPEYEFPDEMSYEEADRLGLVKPVFNNTRKRALNDRHQIPVPNGVGFTRVLPFEDPRTQAALAVQEIALQNAAQAKYSVPSIQRDYEIKPSRTVGIESPQYAMFADLVEEPVDGKLRYSANDADVRFWKENIPGLIPQGVVDVAYVPVTMNPRNEQGRKPAPEVLMPGINGRIMKGKDIKFYGYAPLDLEYAMNHVHPKAMEEYLAKGLTEDDIKQRVLDNALSNAQIKLDGKMYPLTREATEPFFDATPTSKYYQASNNIAFRGASVNSPIVNDVIGEPSDDWVMEQMAKGNLNFSPENWMSDNERTTLRQREVYADPSIQPRDIVDAIDVAQRKKNVIDAQLNNIEQRLRGKYEFNKNLASIDELQRQSEGLRDEINYASQTGRNLQATKLLERKRQLDLAIQSRQANIVNAVGDWYLPELNQDTRINPGQVRKWNNPLIVGLRGPLHPSFIESIKNRNSPVEIINDPLYNPAVPRQQRMSLAEQSSRLGDEIRRATIAQNQLYQVENTPEVTITRQGKPWQLQEFLDISNSVLGMETVDDSFQYRNNPNEVYSASVAGSFPMRSYLTPYEQTKALDIPYEVEVNGQERQFRLLPSRRTSQLFTPVPTSNMKDLSREPVPFPEEIITTSQVVPQGNVVTPLPSSSGNYPFRSGGNANYQTWDTPSTDGLGLLGFDGGSIPGDYIASQEVLPLHDNPRTPISSQVRSQPQQPRTSVRTPQINVVEPETVMAGTKIPKWAIPASLGAAWLALAGYQRSRKEQEERQRQQVNM